MAVAKRTRTPAPKQSAARRIARVDLRVALVETARAMNASGINQGTSGNVSVRSDAGFLITPTGMRYDEMRPAHLVPMDFDGGWTGPYLPSSEWRFHLDIYRARPDVLAIVHTHSTSATALSCLERSIPPFHYQIAVAGGPDIRLARYATFGTQELSDNAVAALEGRKACLLSHHGVIACGATLPSALSLAIEVENLARMYLQCLTVGEPPLLSDDEMATILTKFATYGQPQRASD